MSPKYFIGPMSKNIVDTIIEFCNETNNTIGLIPSRRQIENTGGYVNSWTTKEFSEYIRSKTNKILLIRDHSGPEQGQISDDGYESLNEDCKYLDVIHIDPWKKYSIFSEGLEETIKMIEYCYNQNSNIQYEIGTEEAIRKFEVDELDTFINVVKTTLSDDIFGKIEYLVIQCGTSLCQGSNTGLFDEERLRNMLSIANKYGLKAKEHNGDWIDLSMQQKKLNMGLRYVNIAPELGELETKVILSRIRSDDFDKLFQICLDSGRWKKWVSESFHPYTNKKELILITGHYIFSDPLFINIKSKYPGIDHDIKTHIRSYLKNLIKLK